MCMFLDVLHLCAGFSLIMGTLYLLSTRWP